MIRDKKEFDREMAKIAKLDQLIREKELLAEARLKKRAKIRAVVCFFLWFAMFATAFFYRKELQQFSEQTLFAPPKVGKMVNRVMGGTNFGGITNTGEALKSIQSQASRRDEVMTEAENDMRSTRAPEKASNKNAPPQP